MLRGLLRRQMRLMQRLRLRTLGRLMSKLLPRCCFESVQGSSGQVSCSRVHADPAYSAHQAPSSLLWLAARSCPAELLSSMFKCGTKYCLFVVCKTITGCLGYCVLTVSSDKSCSDPQNLLPAACAPSTACSSIKGGCASSACSQGRLLGLHAVIARLTFSPVITDCIAGQVTGRLSLVP